MENILTRCAEIIRQKSGNRVQTLAFFIFCIRNSSTSLSILIRVPNKISNKMIYQMDMIIGNAWMESHILVLNTNDMIL